MKKCIIRIDSNSRFIKCDDDPDTSVDDEIYINSPHEINVNTDSDGKPYCENLPAQNDNGWNEMIGDVINGGIYYNGKHVIGISELSIGFMKSYIEDNEEEYKEYGENGFNGKNCDWYYIWVQHPKTPDCNDECQINDEDSVAKRTIYKTLYFDINGKSYPMTNAHVHFKLY